MHQSSLKDPGNIPWVEPSDNCTWVVYKNTAKSSISQVKTSINFISIIVRCTRTPQRETDIRSKSHQDITGIRMLLFWAAGKKFSWTCRPWLQRLWRKMLHKYPYYRAKVEILPSQTLTEILQPSAAPSVGSIKRWEKKYIYSASELAQPYPKQKSHDE